MIELRARAIASRAPEDGLAFLAALPPSTIKMGLSRVVEALEQLGHPERAVPALHVAGTNGKGSTCAFAASCLAQRYRVGLYTSPHLERPNERIKLNGVDIDDDTLGRRIIEVIERLPSSAELTYFELGTVVAFWHFAQEKVDLAVLETGLGGRLDATTACMPLVTTLTPIAFDHMEYLGSTLAQIAVEKAGIVKAGVPVISSVQTDAAREVIIRAAEVVGARLWLEGRDFSVEGQRFEGREWHLDSLAPALRGPFQRQNLAVALASLEALSSRGFPLSHPEVVEGVARTRWPGRLEEFPTSPPVILDGAHNPAGVRALLTALDEVYPGREVHLVFGVFADKEWKSMVEALFPRCASVHLTPILSPRALTPAAYLDTVRHLSDVTAWPSVVEALAAARARCGPKGIVVCAGSLFLLGQVRPLLRAH